MTDFRYRRGDINLGTFSRQQEKGCSLTSYIVQLKNANDIVVTVKQLNVLEHNFWRLVFIFSRDQVLPEEQIVACGGRHPWFPSLTEVL